MKDNFSTQAKQYAKFRPTYPPALYDFIAEHINDSKLAWDCATGNGQVAAKLASFFETVYATDISAKQLENAVTKENITYKVEPAENTSFANHSFDLITVAQAIHWFKFEPFFEEVKRVLKPDGLFVAVGYGLMQIDEAIDDVVLHLYEGILGKYWDEERRHIEQNYETIPFPFQEIESPNLYIETEWSFDQLLGYLATWSSLQHYLKKHQENPLDLVMEALKAAWGNETTRQVIFSLIIKAGRI